MHHSHAPLRISMSHNRGRNDVDVMGKRTHKPLHLLSKHEIKTIQLTDAQKISYEDFLPLSIQKKLNR